MAAAIDTKHVLAAVARLTADSGKQVQHGLMFRVVVESADGERCGVPIQVDNHPGVCRPYVVNQVADSLLVDRTEIRQVLDSGTHVELVAHLKHYTKEELKPIKYRSGQVAARSFWNGKLLGQ